MALALVNLQRRGGRADGNGCFVVSKVQSSLGSGSILSVFAG